MNVMELLTSAVEQNAADIFLIPGMPFSYKIGGRIICQGDNRIMPDEMDKMITEIYGLAKNRGMDKVQSHGDDDFSFAIPGVSRFRASVFRQRGSLAGIIRVVRFELPDAGQLHLPDSIIGVSRLSWRRNWPGNRRTCRGPGKPAGHPAGIRCRFSRYTKDMNSRPGRWERSST